MVKFVEAPQFGVPFSPLAGRRKEVVPNIAEKFDFHDMYLLHRYPRNFGPRFVSVGVVVQDCKTGQHVMLLAFDDSSLTFVS